MIWLKKTYFNTKVTKIEGKIPRITGLATNSELTAVENKIPDASSLVTKTYYAAEITQIKNDYVINAALDARHKDLVQKTTFESEFKKVDDKASANSSNVLSYEHKLKLLISEAKIILVIMVCKIILYFSRCISILKG